MKNCLKRNTTPLICLKPGRGLKIKYESFLEQHAWTFLFFLAKELIENDPEGPQNRQVIIDII